MKLASQEKLRNVLIFEDDVSFRDVKDSLIDQIVSSLASRKWDIVYFGYLSSPDMDLEGPLAQFSKGVMGAHFYAVNASLIDPLLQFMNQCETRPPGSPEGGPMTADGALNHVRLLIPDMRVLLAVPNLAHQRSSRTDVSPQPIFDQIVVLRPLIRKARVIKHKLRMLLDRKSLLRKSNTRGRADND